MDWTMLQDKIPAFIAANGMKLVAAILIYIIGAWIAKMVSRMLRKLMTKSKVDNTLVVFLGNLVHALLLVFVVIAAIGKLGVQTTSFVAIIGAAGLAVGLALQGSLGNFASGVMLILFKPFKVGDSVTAAGNTGVVRDIGIFHSVIVTSDGKKVIIPNGAITGGAITNLSAMPTRRVELIFSVPGNTEINKARELLLGYLAADERILKDPAASVSISEATAGEVKFGVYAHVNNADLGAVQAALLEKVKLGFTSAGIWA